MSTLPKIRRRKWKLNPNSSHVICRPHIPSGSPDHIQHILARVLALSEAEAAEVLAKVMLDFSDRHRHLKRILEQHFNQVVTGHLPGDLHLSDTQRALIGTYVTMEYAVSSAALFNPSIVPHPDQNGLEPGSLRFVMSLRAVGEGHVSSIVFRGGVIGPTGTILFDPVSDYVETPSRQVDPSYDRNLFQQKLLEMNAANEITAQLLGELPEQFSYNELQSQIENVFHRSLFDSSQQNEAFTAVNWLANSNYKLDFQPGQPISERVIFSISEHERSGIEDARFVQFHDDNGDITYYATYTAYDGSRILPQLLETSDFLHFKMNTLNGRAVQNKGLALFPRKINGKYAMLSRQDGENNHLMYSDHLHFWQSASVIQEPCEPWEFVQIGNCGSPLETSEGWLVLTHGVGPMREYAIGVVLLDLDDPARVIARLTQPLLSPHEQEREGYVPNVVYSCGALIHNHELIIPYAMSDISSGLASVNVRELIDCMKLVG